MRRSPSTFDARQNPDLVRTDIGDEKLANGCDARIIDEKGSDSVPVRSRDRLAEKEIVIATDETKTDAHQHKRNQHGGNRLGKRRPGNLAERQTNQREEIPEN